MARTVTASNVNVDATTSGRAHRARKGRGASIAGGWRVAFWFLLPALLGFTLFFLIPTIRAVLIGFQDFDFLANKGRWIGLANYTKLFHDKTFWNSVGVTLRYVVINMVSQTVLAFVLAVLMDRLAHSVFLRGLLLVPWVLPNIVVGLLWLFILDPTVGIFNKLLQHFVVDKPILFVNSTSWVLWTLAFVNTWKYTGYTALLLFAGMQVIPRQVYEAASLDGASEARMMRTITLPLMRPVLALVLVVNVVGSFQVFDVVAAMSGGLGGQPGGPLGHSRVVYLYIYENAFLFRKFGYASAIATMLMLFLLLVSVMQLWLLRASRSDLA